MEASKNYTIKYHPLYPKPLKPWKESPKESIKALREAIWAEDSELRSVKNDNGEGKYFGHKEGIIEDSGDWYFDKLEIVNEDGHTDHADFIGQIAKF